MTLLMGVGNIEPLLPVVLIVLIFVGGLGLIARSAFKMMRRERKTDEVELGRREATEARRDYP